MHQHNYSGVVLHVEFECADINDKVLCLVKGFVVFESADEMAALLPPEVFGYDDKEEVRVAPKPSVSL